MPPGPMRLTTRFSPRSSSCRTWARSCSRPIVVVYGAGTPGDEGCRVGVGRIAGERLVEPLGQQGGEVAGHPLLQLGGRLERKVRGGVVALDARDQSPSAARRGGRSS